MLINLSDIFAHMYEVVGENPPPPTPRLGSKSPRRFVSL